MKALIRTVLISCALAAPALSFAQSVQAPITRAEVRTDLIRLEQAGYKPGTDSATYPEGIQAAEARVQAEDAAAATGAAASAQPQAHEHMQAALPSGTVQPRIDDVRSSFYNGA